MITINDQSGLLTPVYFIPSPNCDERPDASDMSLLVIHGISLPPGEFGGDAITQLFNNALNPNDHPFFQEIFEARVSSHLLIRRDGMVIQYVPFLKRAWHAGASIFEGREKCNDYSIGIELEGTDDSSYTEKQYKSLAKVSKVLMTRYPKITMDRIVGHSDVAPGRKTDPGPAFDWEYYKGMLVCEEGFTKSS